MQINELNIVVVVFFWFVSLFALHFLMHNIRFKMLKCYIKKGFEFYHLPYVGVGSMSTSEIKRAQSLGIATLGWPIKRFRQFTFWSVVDFVYYLVMILFSVICFGLMLDYYVDKHRQLFAIKLILGSDVVDSLTFIFCIIVFAILPHFWLVYFNRKRFKYYVHHRTNSTYIISKKADR